MTGVLTGFRLTVGPFLMQHWDAYSLEDAGGFTRHNFSAKVSDYMLSSTYWPAW